MEAASVVMTAAVKQELSGLGLAKLCCRRAEVSALLRFAGGLQPPARQQRIGLEPGARKVMSHPIDCGRSAAGRKRFPRNTIHVLKIVISWFA